MQNWSGLLCLQLELLAAGGDVPFAWLFTDTALLWDVMPNSPSHNQDSGTEGETSTGFPCQVLLAHLLPTSEDLGSF